MIYLDDPQNYVKDHFYLNIVQVYFRPCTFYFVYCTVTLHVLNPVHWMLLITDQLIFLFYHLLL